MKKRVDKILTERKIIQSRQRANEFIQNNGVSVNSKIIYKPAAQIEEDADIKTLVDDLKWVSRAGLKLEEALKHWQINPKGYICMDIGASTGGFSDVLLQNGVDKIYAIDVGHSQLAKKLKKIQKLQT